MVPFCDKLPPQCTKTVDVCLVIDGLGVNELQLEKMQA